MVMEQAAMSPVRSDLRTVLIVDDDREAVIEIADLLATRGIVFAGYVEAAKALERIDRDPTVEGCFVDLLMPGINGIEFIRRVRSLGGSRGHIPLVAVSGVSEKHFLASAVEAGAMRVLRKPVDPSRLREALDAILGGTSASRPDLPAPDVTTAPDVAPESGPDAASELQQLRLDVELARRVRSEFLGIVNHELRTPLNGVMGLAGLLESSADSMKPEAIRKFASQIIDCGEALVTQIERILELSAERSSEPLDKPEIVPIEEILASACRQVGHIVSVRNAQIRKPASMPHGTIHCRPRRIARSLALVIENAIKFGASPPIVTITLAYRNASWLVSILDNGEGMPTDQMAHAFDAFHLGDSSNTRKHGGLGIGLTLARRYVREQGGEILLDNRPEGGLRADIVLPADPGVNMPPPRRAE